MGFAMNMWLAYVGTGRYIDYDDDDDVDITIIITITFLAEIILNHHNI